jgi:hypothetical protein
MVRWSARVAVIAAALVVVMAWPVGAQDEGAEDEVPDPLLQPTESVEFRADWGGLLEYEWLGEQDHDAHARLLIGVPADELVVSAFYDDGTAVDGVESSEVAGADAAATVEISFPVENDDPRAGWLSLSTAGSDAPQTVPFSVVRTLDGWTYLKQVMVPVVLAFAFILIRHLSLTDSAGKRFPPDHELQVEEGKWTFKDSWASNLVALGAILTTILASDAFTDALAPGVDLSGILVLSLGFTFVALLAPLVFQAASSKPKGTYLGLLAGGYFTFTAVVGQLGTIAMLSHRSGASEWAGLIPLCTGLLVIGWYFWRTIHNLVKQPATTVRSAIL